MVFFGILILIHPQSSPIVERGRKAIEISYNLKGSWSLLGKMGDSACKLHLHGSLLNLLTLGLAWRQLCLPLLSSLARQSSNTSREIRQAAIANLQRIVLGPHILLNPDDQNQVEELFNRIIFPLLDELLKPQVFLRDPMGMPETRLRASALLCKAFMHLEAREGMQADIRVLWIQVLDLLDRLMNIDRRDQLVGCRL